MTYRYHKPDGTSEDRELTSDQQAALDNWIASVNATRTARGQDPLPEDLIITDFFESGWGDENNNQ